VNGPSWVAGKHGTALSLDVDQRLLAGVKLAFPRCLGYALTLSASLNPLRSGRSVVLGKFWGLTMSVYQFELDGGTAPHFYVGTAAGLTGGSMGSGLPLGQWSHVAVVFNGTQVQFYVNGGLVATRPVTASITARGNQLRMGADTNVEQF
jgi:hypothetical protein